GTRSLGRPLPPLAGFDPPPPDEPDQVGKLRAAEPRLLADDPVRGLLGGRARRDRRLEEVGRREVLRELVRVELRQSVVVLEAPAPGGGQLRQARPQRLHPGRVELERWEIRLREVPVVLRELL